jgi:hypothetical protein
MTESGTKLHEDDEELTTADLAATGPPRNEAIHDHREAQAMNAGPGQMPGPGLDSFHGDRPQTGRPMNQAQPMPAAPPESAERSPAGGVEGTAQPEGGARPQPLFAGEEAEGFRARWKEIQVAFVDNPQEAVRDADHLVADTMKRMADTFARERSQLEQQWSGGGNLSTEDLRMALQRYRSFFDRLLSV